MQSKNKNIFRCIKKSDRKVSLKIGLAMITSYGAMHEIL